MNSVSGLYLSAAGMQVEQSRLDVAAQNLANAGTPGYKRVEAALSALPPTAVERTDYAGGNSTVVGGWVSTPVLDRTVARMDVGPLNATGQPLDLAIDGDGLFVVQAPDGLRYTRRGDFHQDGTGRLVNAEGFAVLAGGSPVGSPGAKLSVDAHGTVRSNGSVVGTLDVVDPNRAGPLRRAGGYYLASTGASEVLPPVVPAGGYKVQVGQLEQANVDPLREMVTLMTAVRSYESNQRVMQTQDETLGRAVTELARM